MHTDPDFYDVKIAGWWVWGLCQWIGGGWCVEPQNHKHPKLDGIGKGIHSNRGHDADHRKRPGLDGTAPGRGVHSDEAHGKARNVNTRTRPKLDGKHAGMGVHSDAAHEPKRQMPMLSVGTDGGVGSGGRGVHGADAYSPGRRPQMTDAGRGVHLPSLGNDRGLNGVSAAPCIEWFLRLKARLRRVRVACGDWTRVLGPSVLGKGKNVGGRRPCAVFLDPPYSHEFRDPYLYSEDDADISTKVREWAIEHGDDPDLRIALCGYAGEHEMPSTWTEHSWKAARGYASHGNDNREKERIWFSPHCIKQTTLTDLWENT